MLFNIISLKILEFADAFLMIGYAWLHKYIIFFKKNSIDYYEDELMTIIDKVIDNFQKATSLNKGFIPKVNEEIERLKKQKMAIIDRVIHKLETR